MNQDHFPFVDENGILRSLPNDLSEVNRKRIAKFANFMFLYDVFQDYWVRPRIHMADRKKHREILHAALAPQTSAAVLDIACGTGGAIGHFDQSNDYTGLDISYAMLRQAAKKAAARGFRRYQLVEGNAEELIFPGENFDLALIDTSLHMIPKYRRCVQEAARVLKKGGDLICSCPTVGIDREFDRLWAKIASKRHLHSLKESDLMDACSAGGLLFHRIGTNGGILYFRAVKSRSENYIFK